MNQSVKKIPPTFLPVRSQNLNDAQWQRELFAALERLKATVDSMGEGLLTTDLQGHVQYLNPYAENLIGLTSAVAYQLPVEKVFKLLNETTRAQAVSPVDLCLAESRLITNVNEIVLLNKHGEEFGIDVSAAPIIDIGGNMLGVVMSFKDVSTQRKIASEVAYRASYDRVTGLYNRHAFEKALGRFVQNNREIGKMNALLFIDLDRFKQVNDACGHVVGDQLLKEVAGVMQDCVRKTDMVARIGGDEFGIILRKCDAEKSILLAKSLCKAIGEYRFQHAGSTFEISASIGLVMINESWESEGKLLQAADRACYQAKDEGRNRVHVYVAAHSKPDSMHMMAKWANRIEEALEESKFVLYSQRIFPLKGNAKDQQLAHAEILIRMQGENGELIPPSAFLPAAEQLNMVSRIDRWVVKEVFAWLLNNHSTLEHLDLLSINLSGQSLSDVNFQQFIFTEIESSQVDCSKLCFEVTETSAITNLSDARHFIEVMSKLGVKFSLDDFGSGVSSFGYLNNLLVDYVKIDGQFIQDLVENKVGQATVRCIAEVAKATGKQTIAEWVDNKPVETMLKNMGVDFVQGYLTHEPAPLDEMLEA